MSASVSPRNYPRNLKVDFHKLRTNTLKRYAWHYNLSSSNATKADELACTCAQHFALHLEVNEQQVLTQFVEFCNALEKTGKNDVNGKHLLDFDNGVSGYGSGTGNDSADGDLKKKKGKGHPFPVGDKVAAKIGGEYMLTRIIKHSKRKKQYKVEDADELTEDPATYDINQDYVIAIPKPGQPETLGREYPRGARVLALFPGTSTFYAATVAKKFERPKGRIFEYGLRFDDDEKDANGEVRMKKISAYEVVAPPRE